MTKDSESSESKKEAPKGENPPAEKVEQKKAAESGKTFQGKGREVRK